MLMKAGSAEEDGDWESYITKLRQCPEFRGGSSLGNGVCASKESSSTECTVTGFMRFEAETLASVRALLAGNPHYEGGGEVEILELIED